MSCCWSGSVSVGGGSQYNSSGVVMMQSREKPKWPARALQAAGALHLLFAAGIFLRPSIPFQWLDLSSPDPVEIWQGYGLILGALGVGLMVASIAPAKHWLVAFTVLLMKIMVPAGFLVAAFQGRLAWSLGATLLFTDVVWWAPLTGVLYNAFRQNTCTAQWAVDSWDETIGSHVSQRGATLHDLSMKRRVLVVFIRHAGCTFCREMLADLAAQRSRLEAKKVEIAVVHMSSPLHAATLAIRYGLEGVHLFSDPECELYEAFGLERGSIGQLFGPKVFMRGLWAGLIHGHGIGALQGDSFRLQGAFVLSEGRVLVACRGQTAADPIDFVALCNAAKSTTDSGETLPSTETAEA